MFNGMTFEKSFYSATSKSINEFSEILYPYIESKYRWSQDWISWIKEDIVDFVVIMNYEENINKFNLNNTLITNRLSNDELSKVYVGVSTYNQSVQDASDKILLSRLNGFENFSIFNYDVQKDTTNWYQPMMKLLNFNID